MTQWKDIEELSSLVLELGLPQREMALWGLQCPFCGKNDRIFKLEPPAQLPDAPEEYRIGWEKCNAGGELAVCRFCRQLLSLGPEAGSVSPLEAH